MPRNKIHFLKISRSKWKRILINSFFVIIVIGIILMRFYVIGIYQIPTSSMEPTILPGDRILVNKSSYGPRVINIKKLLFEKKQNYRWYRGSDSILTDDIFVFNFPRYEWLKNGNSHIYGEPIVKRCYGISGDTVRIKYSGFNSVPPDSILQLFPLDSSLNWKIDDYGPLWIPAKGSKIQLTEKNIRFYNKMMLYEGNKITIRNDSVIINNQPKTEYTFKYNYYFMLGDNFYGSQDSRFWGFVPETHVIGKATYVLFSFDPKKRWYKKFRWNRFLKRI